MRPYPAIWRMAARVDAWTRQKGRCYWCRIRLQRDEVTAEHLKPLARGGTDHGGNIVAACQPCNSARGALPANKFRKLLRNARFETHGFEIAFAAMRARLEDRTILAEQRLTVRQRKETV